MSRFTHILHAAILAHLLFIGQHSEAKPALPLADAPIAHCFAWPPSPCLTGAGVVFGVQPDPEIDRSPIWAVIYGRYIYLLGREMFWPEIAKQDRFRIAIVNWPDLAEDLGDGGRRPRKLFDVERGAALILEQAKAREADDDEGNRHLPFIARKRRLRRRRRT